MDCRDAVAVLREMARRFDPRRDVIIVGGTSTDTLDFTGPRFERGSKMILDFTGDVIERSAPNTLPDLAARYPAVDRQRLIGDAALLVRVREGQAGRPLLEKLVADPSLAQVPLIVVVSADVNLDDRVSWLWGWFTRFDPASDTIFRHSALRGAMAVHDGPMGIDATWKQTYPKALEMPPEITRRVDDRWKELGLSRW